MRALFRADASEHIGGGHLVRCLSLAKELSVLGWQCEFVVCREATVTIPWFARAGFNITYIPEHILGDERRESEFIGEVCGKFDIAIVDHYERGSNFEKAVSHWARSVVAIEDIPARLHVADVILDPTFGRSKEEYRLVAPRAEVLAGADYTLLRGAFYNLRTKAMAKRLRQQGRIGRVLIAFGASDPENYTGNALNQLMKLSGFEIDLLVGKLHPQTTEFISLADSSAGRLRVWHSREDIEELMLDCDLAIGGAGGQSWERCCLGLPSLLVEMAANQRDVAVAISTNGAGILLGKGLEAISQHLTLALIELMENPPKVIELSEAAFKLCDGLGAQRAAKALMQLHERRL